MSRMWNVAIALPAVLTIAAAPAIAQQSASYKLTESTFNAGGHPAGGTTPASASYRISFDAVGELAVATDASSASYAMGGGFASGFCPPGEVHGLQFADKQILEWDPERSLGLYNLYRDLISNVMGGGYGNCEQLDLADEIAVDATNPPSNDGYFYLVTAMNRLREEGTKGSSSDGVERLNASPCP